MKILSNTAIDTSSLDRLNGSDMELEALRQLRKPLLEAFDIYKVNIIYGISTESEEDRTAILDWYQRLLDLDKTAITNVPKTIVRFIA